MTKTGKQVRFSQFGEPEVLETLHTPIPKAGPGEVLIRTKAIGVNYSDILRRRNAYFQPTPLPFVPGTEAVGEIVERGEGVPDAFPLGMRVLAVLPYGGGYAEFVRAQALYCIPLPPEIEDSAATGIFVQGSTAMLLSTVLAPELEGKTVLIQAAGGGVGSLLVQLAKQKGARVLAAGSDLRKLDAARQYGVDGLVDYSKPDWAQSLRNEQNGTGVDVVFEMVGGEVYNQSIRLLNPGGTMLVYGCASGVQGQIHPEFFVDHALTQKGFNLAWYIQNQPEVWQKALGEVIGQMASGMLTVATPHVLALEEAATAHRLMESRQSVGKIVLVTTA